MKTNLLDEMMQEEHELTKRIRYLKAVWRAQRHVNANGKYDSQIVLIERQLSGMTVYKFALAERIRELRRELN